MNKYFYDEKTGQLLILGEEGIRAIKEIGGVNTITRVQGKRSSNGNLGEEIKSLIAEGKSNGEVARILGISTANVSYHTKKGKKSGTKRRTVCRLCGEDGHVAKTCPLEGNHDLRLGPTDRLPSDEEASRDTTFIKEQVEERILQGGKDLELAEEFGYKSPSTVAHIRHVMRKEGRLPANIERHDPDDLSDLKEPDELELVP